MHYSLKGLFTFLAAAVALLQTATPSAEAAIVYTGDVNLTKVADGQSLYFSPITQYAQLDTPFPEAVFILYIHSNDPALNLDSSFSASLPEPIWGTFAITKHNSSAILFEAGSSIDSSLHFEDSIRTPLAATTTGYLGLNLEINGLFHYGWAHVTYTLENDFASITLHDFAYEDQAGVPIVAGAIPEPSSLIWLSAFGFSLLLGCRFLPAGTHRTEHVAS